MQRLQRSGQRRRCGGWMAPVNSLGLRGADPVPRLDTGRSIDVCRRVR